MKRVLFVSDHRHLDGAERSLLDTMSAVDRSRFDMYLLCPAPGDLSQAAARAGVPCFFAPSLRRLTRNIRALPTLPWNSLKSAVDTVRLAHHLSVDIVHCNSVSAGLQVVPAKLLQGFPMLYWCRDLPIPPEVSILSALGALAVAPSTASCTRLVELKTRCCHVPNGIEIHLVGENRHRDDANLLMVGQFAPWKRHEDAILAVSNLVRRGVECRLSIAGRTVFGDGSYEHYLRELVRKLNLSTYVEFLGQVDDIRQLLRRATMLVHPAKGEAFGRVIVEALAEGCPVVATLSHHGPAEILDHGKFGVLVPSEDPQGMAECIHGLLANPGKRQALSQLGIARAAHFDRRRTTVLLQDVWQRLG